MAEFSKNPEFGKFMDVTADILEHGISLTYQDISWIGSFYGYSEDTRHINDEQERRDFVIAMALRGVGITYEVFKTEHIFYDECVDESSSDLEAKKKAITQRRFEASDIALRIKYEQASPKAA